MTQEIIEAVREIERDKGIEEGALVAALEDAPLAAYKETPGEPRHASDEMGDGTGDVRELLPERAPPVHPDAAREGRLRDAAQRGDQPRRRGVLQLV